MGNLLRRYWFPGLILSMIGLLLVGCAAAAAQVPLVDRVTATPLPAAAASVASPRPGSPTPAAASSRPTPVPRSQPSGSPPAVSEIPSPGSVRIQNTSSSLDSTGKFRVIGEIANNSESPIYDPAVVVEFRSADGTLVGVQNTNALVRMLGKGEKGPFVLLASPPSGWAKVSFSLSYDTNSPRPASHALRFSDQNQYTGNAINVNQSAISATTKKVNVDPSAINVSTDARFFVGKVTNNSPHPLHFTTVILTGYDANGKVVRTAAAFVGKSGDLASGATVPYQLMLSSNDAKAVVSVALMAEGEGE